MEELLGEGVYMTPTYGNTLMGLACSKPVSAEDGYKISYYAPQPRAVIEVVSFEDRDRVVPYSKSGRVRLTVVLQKHTSGDTEPTTNLIGRLFSLQSENFPDELNLPKDIPFRQPPHLAFPDHVQNLVALNRSPRAIEGSKSLAGIHPALDPSMVLFHNIV